ncbi:MAG: hypothetical protein SFU25_05815 [Candidatus Caenarcaniphilales bacterium]|nr:hypothetical protein [Candidatus Caenarcaniphilales bacterium]
MKIKNINSFYSRRTSKLLWNLTRPVVVGSAASIISCTTFLAVDKQPLTAVPNLVRLAFSTFIGASVQSLLSRRLELSLSKINKGYARETFYRELLFLTKPTYIEILPSFIYGKLDLTQTPVYTVPEIDKENPYKTVRVISKTIKEYRDFLRHLINLKTQAKASPKDFLSQKELQKLKSRIFDFNGYLENLLNTSLVLHKKLSAYPESTALNESELCIKQIRKTIQTFSRLRFKI